jgi:Domain of unknown function (DUF4331)
MSDHFSGPRALAGPQCDICDLYAFTSPERPENLVLVMDVVPRATPTSTFSDAIIYRFRLRPATIAGTGAAATFALGEDELVIDCTFDEPRITNDGRVDQIGRCRSPFAGEVVFGFNDERGGISGGVRAFAGLRSEPFFIDFPALQQTLMTGKLAFREVGTLQGPRGVDSGSNVLALVVEVPSAALKPLGIKALVSVVGETLSDGKLQIRLERVGRPEIKNLLLGPKNHDPVNRDLEMRDLYNLEDAYHIGPDYRNAYRARLDANLGYMDSLDGKSDWSLDANGHHPLTDLILGDYLVVDPSKPYAEDSFFEIESAMLSGAVHESSGGRSLNDQVMDTIYTLCVNGGNGPRISDGLKQSTERATLTFPYLVAPNPPRDVVRPGVPVRPDHVHADGTVHHHHTAFGKYEL